jgi:hypothetical protein
MKMQDKELDELFRSKLDDLEVTPSANVWAGIDAGLEKDRRRKAYIQFLSIAASIIVLFIIGVLFIPHGTRIGVKTVSRRNLAKVTAPIKGNDSTEEVAVESNSAKIGKSASPVYNSAKAPVGNSGEPDDSIETTSRLVLNVDEQLASINASKTTVITPVLPLEGTQIANLQPIQIKPPQTIEQQPIIAQVPASKDKGLAVKPKHNSLSLGNLINAMVAKVDKRQDKIIEFTDDDGESSITGVNLGVIKIKKDQQTTEK